MKPSQPFEWSRIVKEPANIAVPHCLRVIPFVSLMRCHTNQ